MLWLSVGEVGRSVCVLSWFVLVLLSVVVVVFCVVMVLFCVFKVGVMLVLVELCGSVVVSFWLFVEFGWWFELDVERLSKRVVSGSFLSFSVMSSSVVFR